MSDDRHGYSGTFLLVLFGLIAAYAAAGLAFGLFGPLWRDVVALMSGDYASIAARDDGVPSMIAEAMTIAIIAFPFSAIPATIVNFLLRKEARAKKGAIHLLLPQPGKEPPTGMKALALALHKIAAIVLYEEFYTRWIFLGALAGTAWLSGPTAFYALFFIGNGIWALIHLTNYPAGARNPLRILPHFFLGIPPTVMFLRYGLPGAFAAHFLWNMIPILPGLADQARRRVPLTLQGSG